MTEQQVTALTAAIQQLAASAKSTPPSWYEHADLMSYLVYAAFAWIFWKLNRNIDDLYKKHNGVNDTLQELVGAHDAYTGGGTHPCRRRSDKPGGQDDGE
jgi:hypothetical protein